MNERKENIYFPLLLLWLKSLPVRFECEQDEFGNYAGSVIDFQGIAYAADYDGLKRELVKEMRSWSDVLKDDIAGWAKGRENQLPLLVKVLSSTDEELLSCLVCDNSESI